jgi:surfactin synthase thioesterase subunit
MKFHSGFSLKNEEFFFEAFLKKDQYTVAGFSYGAIKAFEDVKKMLKQGIRVDTLQLFSPAFFQSKSEKFKRLQTLSYTKSKESYIKQFIHSCFSPLEVSALEHKETSIAELEELLSYIWDQNSLYELTQNGVMLEVYLGEKDAVIDTKGAREFFTKLATVSYIKNANHFLQTQ